MAQKRMLIKVTPLFTRTGTKISEYIVIYIQNQYYFFIMQWQNFQPLYPCRDVPVVLDPSAFK